MAPKRKRVCLSLQDKCNILDKLEKGVSVHQIHVDYGIAKQTISDLKKNKVNIRAYAEQIKVSQGTSDPNFGKRKMLRKGKYEDVEKAVVKWYRQQESVGVSVPGFQLQNAARRLAVQLNCNEFIASNGWLHRFRQRHGMFQKKTHGESGSAAEVDVEPFRKELNKLIDEEGLLLSQVYNFDETGIYWRALPDRTQVMGHVRKAKGRKLDKSRLSLLFGANADGTHRLTPVVVGKSAKPRCLKDVIHKLPCHYFSTKKAWFSAYVFKECFFKHIVPAIVKFQREVLGIGEDRIRSLILLDNAPAHPAKEELVAYNGKIRCLFLPANTTSLIQPMDQGVINAAKLHYRRLFLEDVLEVEEMPEDEEEDTRGLRTLANLKAYSIKNAIYNLCEAWKALKQSTLANAWKRLLYDIETMADFDGFEVEDFVNIFKAAKETATAEDVTTWLGMDEGDPGHQMLSEEEIVQTVVDGDEGDDDDDEDDEDHTTTRFCLKLSQARESLDNLIQMVDIRTNDFSLTDYEDLRRIRRKVITLQHSSGKQKKISSFFRTPTPTPTNTPEPQPSTSTAMDPPSSPPSSQFLGFYSDSE